MHISFVVARYVNIDIVNFVYVTVVTKKYKPTVNSNTTLYKPE